MPEMQFHCLVNRPIDVVFQLITDLGNYDKWLPPSNLFTEVSTISDNPIRRGTTYINRGPSALMQGEVTDLVAPTQVSFHQVTRFKRFGLQGGIEIEIHYVLESFESGTRVTRNVTFALFGPLKFLQPLLLRGIRRESERILQEVKTYLESQSQAQRHGAL